MKCHKTRSPQGQGQFEETIPGLEKMPVFQSETVFVCAGPNLT